MQEKLQDLKTRLAEVDDLDSAASLLEWDQLTYMPSGGAQARADQFATLERISHEKFTDTRVGELVEALSAHFSGAPADDDDAAFVRVAARRYRRKTRIPAALVAEISKTTSLAQEVWARARAANDFALFLPYLQRVFDLKRQEAACFGEAESPYDALLDSYEPGMTAAQVRSMFSELKSELVPLVRAIAARPPVDDSVVRQHYDPQAQWDVSIEAIRVLGYDLERGRQDRSAHPFCTSFGLGDVRITTRVTPNYLPTCLMGSMHECGHALYEQGFPARYARSPLGHSASLGIHESQSRMWENLVGRSREFWTFFYPRLQAAFPAQLSQVDMQTFYRALNKVQPSFIRVDADEVTYNLHTLLRFELEVDLLEGRLELKDAPAAWNAKFAEYFGLDVPDDRLGVLQDTHWAAGLVGYFPTYSLGNLASVQLFDKAAADVPGLRAGFARGEFRPLLEWLRANVHCHGRKYLPGELIQVVTGQPLSGQPYVSYLKRKYGELYSL